MASKLLYAKSFASTVLLVTVLALAVGFIKPGFTNDSQDKRITIENIPTYKLELTRSSVMIQKSWNYLLSIWRIHEIVRGHTFKDRPKN